jgi:hypothetical protein
MVCLLEKIDKAANGTTHVIHPAEYLVVAAIANIMATIASAIDQRGFSDLESL